MVRSALLDEALAEGLKGHIETLQDRLRRLTERADARRQIARDAMLEVDLKKITAPDFTVSVRPGSPALVVTDEAAIPAAYWRAARAAPRPAGSAQRPQEGRGGVPVRALQSRAGAQREGQVDGLLRQAGEGARPQRPGVSHPHPDEFGQGAHLHRGLVRRRRGQSHLRLRRLGPRDG